MKGTDVLPLGCLYVWAYDEEADDAALTRLAEQYGGGPNVDPTEAFLYLNSLVPAGYELRREDGLLGVWEVEEEE